MGASTSRGRKFEPLAVLFTCIGRRVQLLDAFRRAGDKLGIQLTLHGADASVLSPAFHRVDKSHLVPPIAEKGYVETLLELVRRHRIKLVVPLLDFELPLLAPSADRFAEIGCVALVSSEGVVRTCWDKLATHQLLKGAGIDTPDTWEWDQIRQSPNPRFPYYLKPRRGSAGVGNFVIRNAAELETFGRRVHDALVQELIEGSEFTVDVYCGLDGVPRCAVPRRRLEVRNGEVSKGVIVKNPAVMSTAMEVARVLRECRGVVTVQCMVTPPGRVCVLEINPRFGGGVPLAIHAGADFPRWILMEVMGRKPRILPAGFKDDIVMLRYDDAVYVPRASRLAPELGGDPLG